MFNQYGVKCTALKPHVVSPSSPRFRSNVDTFDRICRVVSGIKGVVVGAIGARTTPFKTVRIDEVALQRHDITVETLDLSEVFSRMSMIKESDAAFIAKAERLEAYASWEGVPRKAFEQVTRLGVTLDAIIEEYQLDAIAVRCWTEMQLQLGVSPCVLMGEMNGRGIASACEVDLGNAIVMRALGLASDGPAACLDWNNNYVEDDDKCILFHCGPVPAEMMAGKGRITDHDILKTSIGEGISFGCNVGRIATQDFTFGSLLTDAGKIRMYVGQGRITEDPIPFDFFGCAGVAEIPRLQDVLLHIGQYGHRHHVSIAPGWVQEPVREALAHYLGFEVAVPQSD
jgi:L-fucose isomerase-like protein